MSTAELVLINKLDYEKQNLYILTLLAIVRLDRVLNIINQQSYFYLLERTNKRRSGHT